jgi:hypothetical protein
VIDRTPKPKDLQPPNERDLHFTLGLEIGKAGRHRIGLRVSPRISIRRSPDCLLFRLM